MNTMNLVMAAVMLGMHYPVARLYVGRAMVGVAEPLRTEIRDALAGRMRLLFGAWCAVLAAAGIWLAVAGIDARTTARLAGASAVGFHVLWWPFVMPVMLKLQAELKRKGVERSPVPSGPTRTATLQPRLISSYLSARMRLLPVALGITAVAAIVWRTVQYPPSEARFWIMIPVFGASGLFFLVAWNIWVRHEVVQSYPTSGDEELIARQLAAAESLRRFRIAGIYWLQLGGASVFFVTALLCIEVGRGAVSESAVGLFGAIAGGTIGGLGGLFGSLASLRAHKAMREGAGETG